MRDMETFVRLVRRQLITHITCTACGHQMVWSTWAGRYVCGYCD